MQPCRSAVASRLAVVETQEEIPFAVAGQRRRDEENLFAQHLLGCMEPAPRLVDGVQVHSLAVVYKEQSFIGDIFGESC